jgi:hypothetical protein
MYMTYGYWHSLTCFFVCWYALGSAWAVNYLGAPGDLQAAGTAVFVSSCLVVTLKLCIRTRNWNWITWLVYGLSTGLLFPFVWVVSFLWRTSRLETVADMAGVAHQLFAYPAFWLAAVVLAPGVALLPDLAILCFRRYFRPTLANVLQARWGESGGGGERGRRREVLNWVGRRRASDPVRARTPSSRHADPSPRHPRPAPAGDRAAAAHPAHLVAYGEWPRARPAHTQRDLGAAAAGRQPRQPRAARRPPPVVARAAAPGGAGVAAGAGDGGARQPRRQPRRRKQRARAESGARREQRARAEPGGGRQQRARAEPHAGRRPAAARAGAQQQRRRGARWGAGRRRGAALQRRRRRGSRGRPGLSARRQPPPWAPLCAPTSSCSLPAHVFGRCFARPDSYRLEGGLPARPHPPRVSTRPAPPRPTPRPQVAAAGARTAAAAIATSPKGPPAGRAPSRARPSCGCPTPSRAGPPPACSPEAPFPLPPRPARRGAAIQALHCTACVLA